MLLQPSNPFQPTAHTPVFCPVATVDIAPLLQHTVSRPAASSPRPGLTSPLAGLTSPRGKPDLAEADHMPEQVVPESLQILVSESTDADIQAGVLSLLASHCIWQSQLV